MSTYSFGPHVIRKSEVFYQSKLSLGLVNLKPIVPGHVLVISRRVVPRFTELSSEEVSDLWVSAQTVAKVIEKEYNAESLTFAIQDGYAAGQTVPHVHIHILPRRKNDFARNDDIYHELERVKMDDEYRHPRSQEDMATEASKLRKLFPQIFQ
ncbi:uncharacterized protein VTP21DRAFT_10055 [Calcarisporiella thermophila]|uniref:uncharacterized protein n=1 Tax=Calcarisporiella thermophila TaxID=911321 RepID=UPI00374465E5